MPLNGRRLDRGRLVISRTEDMFLQAHAVFFFSDVPDGAHVLELLLLCLSGALDTWDVAVLSCTKEAAPQMATVGNSKASTSY